MVHRDLKPIRFQTLELLGGSSHEALGNVHIKTLNGGAQDDLMIMDREGNPVASVAAPGYLDAGAAFSPDGKKVVYSKGDGALGATGVPPAKELAGIVGRERTLGFTFDVAPAALSSSSAISMR